MLKYFAVICLVFFVSCHLATGKLQIKPDNQARAIKVANGQTAGEHEFPFIVSIQKQLSSGAFEHLCTGSILSSTFILTAAHCLESSSTLVVVYGTYDNTCSDNCKYIKVKNQISHPSYQKGTERNDIAVFELESALPIDDSTVSTVSIDENSIEIHDEESDSSRLVLVSGWGALNSQLDYPKKLQKASVPIVKMSYCNNLKLDGVDIEQICAGAGNGRDACSGDSGGPLFRKISGSSRYTQFGVVSTGYETCGATVSRGLYSNTTFYLSFIQKYVPGVSVNQDSNTVNPGDVGGSTGATTSLHVGCTLSVIVFLFIISLIF